MKVIKGKSNNVKKVVINGLCSGCGMCATICPTDAITINKELNGYIPFIDEGKCGNCGKCLKVCPFADFADEKGNFEICYNNYSDVYDYFDLDELKVTAIAGYYDNDDIHIDSASGGIITGLLVEMLRGKIISGAIVTKFDTKAMEPRTFLATTIDEIVSAKGTIYVPTKPNEKLKLVTRGYKNLAFVGLPCQVEALKKSELSVHIKYTISLFCSWMPGFLGFEEFLRRYRILAKDVKEFSFRGSGWPGSAKIVLFSGEIRKIDHVEYWSHLFSAGFFSLKSCMLCNRFFDKEADISCGNAHFEGFPKSKWGVSVCIIRNPEILSLLYSKKKFVFREISLEDLIASQKGNLVSKCFTYSQRVNMVLKKKKIKDQNIDFSFLIWFYNKLLLFGNKVSIHYYKFFKYIPKILLRFYAKILSFMAILILKKFRSKISKVTHIGIMREGQTGAGR